ncbi:MAG: DNA cytosine methyltransferase [Sphingomonadaceae bacterium]|nr:DNA cytosine methyltransferase [Sphingomonadaceae bacterium]
MVVCTDGGDGRELRGMSLCAGYGGLELGLAIAETGYRTVCYVEREAHAASTLVARMEDQAVDCAPVWDDLRSFDGKPWRDRVHILTAGYPCQPFSVAGKRRGKRDPRHLWPEVERIIGEVRPAAVFVENVEGHLDVGFAEVRASLERLGYHTKAGLFTAREVGASHRRRRLFILAYADSDRRGLHAGPDDRSGIDHDQVTVLHGEDEFGAVLADQCGAGLVEHVDGDAGAGLAPDRQKLADAESIFAPGPGELPDWNRLLHRRPDLQPAFLRARDGMADRLDRTRGAGNGVCSLAAAFAYRTLKADFAGDGAGQEGGGP